MARDSFYWEAHEYEHREKSKDWFWGLGIVALTIIIISALFGNYLFALLVLVGAFVIGVFANKPPLYHSFEANKSGIRINNHLYPYANLRSFWVEDNDHIGQQSKLHVRSKKAIVPMIVIPIEGIDPGELRDFLLDHLYEEEHLDSLLQILFDRLGF